MIVEITCCQSNKMYVLAELTRSHKTKIEGGCDGNIEQKMESREDTTTTGIVYQTHAATS